MTGQGQLVKDQVQDEAKAWGVAKVGARNDPPDDRARSETSRGKGLGRSHGRGRMGGPFAAGPGGNCVCPNCGATVPHIADSIAIKEAVLNVEQK